MSENHRLVRVAEGAKGKAIANDQQHEEQSGRRQEERARDIRRLKRQLTHETSTKEHQIQLKTTTLRGQLEKQMEMRYELLDRIGTMVKPDAHALITEQLQGAYDSIKLMKTSVTDLEEELDEAREREQELEAQLKTATAGPGRGQRHVDHAAQQLATLHDDVGLQSKVFSVPSRALPEGASERHWRQDSVKHMATVLEGRGEGDAINNVADALHRAGYLERLVDADRFQPIAKGIARAAVAKLQAHWTARHAVHVWDRLELSRSQMETLSNLLSMVYDPTTDKYVPIRVWENPNDPADFVVTARLVGRVCREREYNAIASEMDIVVGADGRCERDAITCTERLYSNYAKALRKEYSDERPAQPVLFLDGTGGALGRGICHGEMGCADFVAVGDSDAKQSRATLQPLFLYQGTDHAGDLRDNLDLAIKSYNKLVDQGTINRVTVNGVTEATPARPLTSADMQGAKSTYGMLECSHSVWCKCQAGPGGPHTRFAPEPMQTHEEMLAFIENEVGCEIKTHEDMCSWAHYSPGVALGGAFTPFKCSCCGYAPSEAEWRADLAVWHALSEKDQVARQRIHQDDGEEQRPTKKHYHQRLFMPPLPHHGMERCGVDFLHLLYLNLFKHLFRYTIHQGLPESKKKLVRDYCKAAGFYSYDACSVDEDPVKHWIGREVKRFLAEAHIHLPFLLQVAAAPADCCPEMAECTNADGDQVMDADDPYAPTAEELAAEEEEEPTMMLHSGYWDNLLDLVRSCQAEWPQGIPDTDVYRKRRELELFNLGSACCNDLLALNPNLKTWVPHILVNIATRQISLLGDPARRSCDACESFGAMTKKLIKHNTCRRRVKGGETSEHKRGAKLWKQTFNVGYIQQAFTRACVRESLQHGEANAAFRQRKDAKRTSAGVVKTCSRISEGVSPAPAGVKELAAWGPAPRWATHGGV